MSKNKENEIYLTRIYDAPIGMVWDVWTDPEHVKHWWGPRGFTLTTKSKDLRPGGQWIYTMHGPDGVDWPNITTYHEVIHQSRLVYDHGASENNPPLFRVTVDFTDMKGSKTKMEMTMAFESPERAKEIGQFIKKAGGNSTWDRLAEYVEKESSGKEIFVINRTFNAPIDLMFDMWTKPEHFSKWLAPTGFDMTYLKSEIKVGETTIYRMSNTEGFSMHGKAKYLEIKKPNLIVYTQEFCDEKGQTTPAPFGTAWPLSMKTSVLLSEEAPNQTRLTVTFEVIGECSREELEAFIKERGGMTQGWTGSFDKLEDYLAK